MMHSFKVLNRTSVSGSSKVSSLMVGAGIEVGVGTAGVCKARQANDALIRIPTRKIQFLRRRVFLILLFAEQCYCHLFNHNNLVLLFLILVVISSSGWRVIHSRWAESGLSWERAVVAALGQVIEEEQAEGAGQPEEQTSTPNCTRRDIVVQVPADERGNGARHAPCKPV